MRLLILDEPVAELDPLARHDFMSTLMEAVAEDGVSVVFSSHVLSELERVCDYLVLLSRGSVQIADETDELLATHRVFIGPVDQADRHHTVPGPVRRLSGPAPLQPMGLLPAEQLVLALPDRRGLRLRHPRHPARRRDRVGPATPSGLSAHRCGRRLGRQPRRGMSDDRCN
jgi:ABC-type microcin C transport system duplicated ATPase subunit YejF